MLANTNNRILNTFRPNVDSDYTSHYAYLSTTDRPTYTPLGLITDTRNEQSKQYKTPNLSSHAKR